jgi:hypothetical protein
MTVRIQLELILHHLPRHSIDKGGMLPGIDGVLVPDLSRVNRIA